MSYEKATVISTLSKIQSGELVLPAIQRDFIWEPERMYKLLDSIFRGYPFSTLLFWNTKQRIQYREFTKDWSNDYRFTFLVKPEGKKGSMVLDGQQRLQTLYLALAGTYENKILYFDVLSGKEPDDISQACYHFQYLAANEVEEINSQNQELQYWVPLRELANLTSKHIAARVIHYLTKLGIAADSEVGQRISHNISTAFGALRADEVLNYFTVDKEFGEDGQETDLEEILEIFVRVNSGGQVLSKSDLMFSLMQMLWEDAADEIADLIDSLNTYGHYEFDKDFILKVALVCVGAGAKYEVKKLRSAATVAGIEGKFKEIANAILNCMEFVRDTAKIVDDRILRSYNTLIPFIYFYYKQPNQVVRGEETLLRMNRALYLALMTGVFSRYADNYIDNIVANILDKSHANQPGHFPLDAFIEFIRTKQGRSEFDDGLLQANVLLLMNILEGGTRLPDGKRAKRPEVDHIFPQSKLRELGFAEAQINDYANFRLISKRDNIWKSNQDPHPYFAANPGAAHRYLVPSSLLLYEKYLEFLAQRRELIWAQVNRFFGLDGETGKYSDNSSPDQPLAEANEITPEEDVVPVTPGALRAYCENLLAAKDRDVPLLSDNRSWQVIMPRDYGNRWRSVYIKTLGRGGIETMGDMVAAILALKLQIWWVEDGYAMVYFHHPGPDGNPLRFNRFGRWGWVMVLGVLEQNGFEWRDYVVNSDRLSEVRERYK